MLMNYLACLRVCNGLLLKEVKGLYDFLLRSPVGSFVDFQAAIFVLRKHVV